MATKVRASRQCMGGVVRGQVGDHTPHSLRGGWWQPPGLKVTVLPPSAKRGMFKKHFSIGLEESFGLGIILSTAEAR